MATNSSIIDTLDTRLVARPDRQRRAGQVAIASGSLFLVMTLTEYAYGLYPGTATGPAFVVGQLVFFAAMAGEVAAIVLLLTARTAGRGAFALVAGSLQSLGIAALIAAGLADIGSGSQESWVYPVAGMANMLGGLLLGIALALPGRLSGWRRWTAIGFGVVPAFVVTPVLIAGGSVVVESLWPLAWVLLGIALISDAKRQPGA